MTGLRSRLLLIAMALLAVGLLASSTVVLGVLRTRLVDRVDAQVEPIGGLFSRLPPDLFEQAGQATGIDPTRALDLVRDVYIGYLSADGTVTRTLRSPSHHGQPGPELPTLDTRAVAAHRNRVFEVPGENGTAPWRVATLPRGDNARIPGTTSTAPEPGSSIVVAASLSEVDATLDRVRLAFLAIGGLIVAVLAAAGWFAVGAGLRPLRRIERTAAAVAAGDLSQRIPDVAGPRTEIGRLAAALNGMLRRLAEAAAAREAYAARMRRFVADASHELRTPLFGIRGFAELSRMGGLSGPEEPARTLAHIERETNRLVALVEDLLLLTRLDEPALPLDTGPMDLRTLAADARHDLAALDPGREVTLTGPGGGGPPASAPVLGDEDRLRQVVVNLVGNVAAHTPAGSPVRIGVGTVGAEAVLEIADRGPGLTTDQAEHVFERFYRVNQARPREAGGGGAGLGLAIVQALVAAHGGRVEAAPGPGGGAVFRVVLRAFEGPGTG